MSVEKSYKELRSEAKIYYKSIIELNCPVFPNEKIVFQNAGFKHLIYKGKIFRPIPDQIRRFKALYYVRDILINTIDYSEYRRENNDVTTAHFWSFEKEINDMFITVVIRKIDNGPLHFFSVRK